jgi:3-phenylpropionate/cinnamic acid dioxygenase small subunit
MRFSPLGVARESEGLKRRVPYTVRRGRINDTYPQHYHLHKTSFKRIRKTKNNLIA